MEGKRILYLIHNRMIINENFFLLSKRILSILCKNKVARDTKCGGFTILFKQKFTYIRDTYVKL